MPMVSICIPAYENPEGIRRLLLSILEQTYRDYEIILTDDSSSCAVRDAAQEVMEGAGENAPSFRYFRNSPAKGAVANWNEAVSHAEGEFVKLMHHDDAFSDKESLGRFVRMLESHPEADLAFSGTYQLDLASGSRKARGIRKEEEELLSKDWRNLYLGNTIGAPSAVMVRRDALLKYGIRYDEALTWIVDSDYYMNLLSRNPHFACTKDPLITIGVSADQLTNRVGNDPKILSFEYPYVYRKYRLQEAGEACAGCLSKILAGCGVPEAEALKIEGITKPMYRSALSLQKKETARRYLDTAEYLYGKAADLLERRFGRFADILFLLGFLTELLLVIVDKSNFTNPLTGQFFRLSFLLFLPRFVITKYAPKERLLILFFLLLGGGCYLVTGRNQLIRFTVFIAAASGMEVKKLLKLALHVTAAGSAVLILLSATGIYGVLKLTDDFGHGMETRWCLGMGHPNALSCMMAMLLILFLYVYGERIKGTGYAVLFAASVCVFGLTRSNTGFIICVLAIFLSGLLHYNKGLRRSSAFYTAGELVWTAGLLYSLLVSIIRPSHIFLLEQLDRIMTGRAAALWDRTYYDGTLGTWHLFSSRLNTVFFDMGWVRLVYWYGVIPAAAILVLLYMVLHKVRQRQDAAAFVMLITMFIYTVPEAHLVSEYIGRNYAFLLLSLYLPLMAGRQRRTESN